MPLDTEQFAQIIEMITKVSDKQDALHGDFREFKGTMTAEVSNITKEMDNTKLWTNIKLAAAFPIMIVLQQIATYFGWLK